MLKIGKKAKIFSMHERVKKILRKTKSVLFTDPQILYKREQHLLNKPFYFKGANGKAVLLIHGWTSVPYEVRRLGKYLNENGWTVYGPMLKGHGTVPKDLENIKWNEWVEDIERAYGKLKKNHGQVFVGGTSIGANIAMLLAMKHPEISGLILMAAPFQMKLEKMKLEKISILFLKIVRIFKKYNKKFYLPTFGSRVTITRVISYKTYPIDSVFEVAELVKKSRENLSEIIQPCFLLQSSSDCIIAGDSMEKIYARISSKVKKKKYIKKAYHTFISDIKNEDVLKEIADFIESN